MKSVILNSWKKAKEKLSNIKLHSDITTAFSCVLQSPKQMSDIFFPKWEADLWVYAYINASFRSLQFEKCKPACLRLSPLTVLEK